MDEAINFADLFLILHKGKIHGAGTLADLRQKINNQEAELGKIFLELTKEV
jgi:ABC-type multidrug transport system ATPase subunit